MNAILKELGYGEDDRVVIFHADDIGMCQSTLIAYRELLDFGLLSSAAVMVPCAWFSGLAAFAKDRSDADIGVHLTLTSEWDSYRWRPISTADEATGLLDDEGFLYRLAASVHENATKEAVKQELEAQIEQALKAGLDITHIDSHMGTLFHEKFLQIYYKMSRKYKLPLLLSRGSEAEIETFGLSDEGAQMTRQIVGEMDKAKIGVFDQIYLMSLDEVWDDGVAQTIELIDQIPAGLTYFIMHPAADTPELRAIALDWKARVRDYHAFKSPKLRDYVQNAGIHVIGYRTLRDKMRQ